jgi:L-threonylcarbamoyladenylate synthase
MEIIKIDLDNLSEDVIKKAVEVVKSGGVIVAPTDTIYGLICDAKNEGAVSRIYEIKKRDLAQPIGVFMRDAPMAKEYVKINKEQEELLKTPDTFILPLIKDLPFQKNTLGIRISHSPLISAIISTLNIPLAQTSANLSGDPLGNDIDAIIRVFEKQNMMPDLVLDGGKLPEKKVSRVIDLMGNEPMILRK